MKNSFLDFEKPIADIYDKIQALKKYGSGDTVSSNQPEEDSAPKPHPTFGYVKGGLVKRPKKRKVNK